MKIVSNINGNTKTTSYGNKLYFREGTSQPYTQVKRAHYRESPTSSYTQIYMYDEVYPVITFTSASGDTIATNYTLTATITDAESGVASITVNGANYPVTSGSTTVNLSKVFTLSYGTNTFTVVVVDVAGNRTESSLTVNYVNDKNNASKNWTTLRNWQEDVSSTNHRYYHDVYVNGTWYTYFKVQNNSGDSWVRSFLTVPETTIPMPRGLSSATFRMKAYGAGGNSDGKPANGNWAISVVDNTTGQTLASYSDEWSHEGSSSHGSSAISFTLNFNQTQSTHNLVVKFSGTGNGWEYSSSSSGVGLSEGNTSGQGGFIFTFY